MKFKEMAYAAGTTALLTACSLDGLKERFFPKELKSPKTIVKQETAVASRFDPVNASLVKNNGFTFEEKKRNIESKYLYAQISVVNGTFYNSIIEHKLNYFLSEFDTMVDTLKLRIPLVREDEWSKQFTFVREFKKHLETRNRKGRLNIIVTSGDYEFDNFLRYETSTIVFHTSFDNYNRVMVSLRALLKSTGLFDKSQSQDGKSLGEWTDYLYFYLDLGNNIFKNTYSKTRLFTEAKKETNKFIPLYTNFFNEEHALGSSNTLIGQLKINNFFYCLITCEGVLEQRWSTNNFSNSIRLVRNTIEDILISNPKLEAKLLKKYGSNFDKIITTLKVHFIMDEISSVTKIYVNPDLPQILTIYAGTNEAILAQCDQDTKQPDCIVTFSEDSKDSIKQWLEKNSN
jgi:hypothetical protein